VCSKQVLDLVDFCCQLLFILLWKHSPYACCARRSLSHGRAGPCVRGRGGRSLRPQDVDCPPCCCFCRPTVQLDRSTGQAVAG
jgi:hypothetical protein